MSSYRKGQDRSWSGAGFLDGVEFRLNEKFKPPPKVILPLQYHQPTGRLSSNFEYNFRNEKNALKWAEDFRQAEIAKQVQEQSQKEAEAHVASLGLDAAKLQQGELPLPVTEASSAAAIPEPIVAILAETGNSMLIPTPSTKPQENRVNAETKNNSNTVLYLADFENEATDPFEVAEMETLNDMEELKSVLQPTLPIENGLIGNLGGVKTQESKPSHLLDTDTSETFEHRDVLDTSSLPVLTSLNGSDEGGSGVLSRFSPLPPITSGGNCLVGSATVNLKEENVSFAAVCGNPPPYNEVIQSVGGSTELSTFVTSFASEQSRMQSVNNQPINGDDCPHYTPLENPFHMLSTDQKQIVNTITEMGFPQYRVARALQRLGVDDGKKVVNNLCAIQHLCDQGFNESRVETALHVNENNEEKAIEFIKLFIQFEELGFKVEDIQRELVKHNNDQDKVLDALTSL